MVEHLPSMYKSLGSITSIILKMEQKVINFI
jgi:hypothetical protein